MSGESAGGIFMNLAYNHFQDCINLLKKRKLKLMHTAANLDGNSGSILEVSALRVLVDGMLAWREVERDLKAEGFYWETNRENLTA